MVYRTRNHRLTRTVSAGPALIRRLSPGARTIQFPGFWLIPFLFVLASSTCAATPTPTPIAGSIVSWGGDSDGHVWNTPSWTGFQTIVAIAAGGDHSLALRSDGTVVSWGDDRYGQVSRTPSGTGFVAIAAGGDYSLALRIDGSIVSWGALSSAPSETGFVAIAGGTYHSLALRIDGSIVSWGDDEYGQVSETPSGTGFVAIAGGFRHSLALRSDRSIVSWGADWSGQVSETPSGTGFVAVAAGGNHSLALRSDGTIVSWGYDDLGQVSSTPSETGFDAIAAGEDHSLASRSDGTIVSWGADYYGVVSETPSETGFVAIAAGAGYSLALRIDGSIVSWGSDWSGQVSSTPSETGFVAIAGGAYHSLALRIDGTIVSWGNDRYGQVSSTPSESGFMAIAGGYSHSLALRQTLLSGWSRIEAPAPVSGLVLYRDKASSGKEMAGLPACLTPATTHYLAHFVSSKRWYTGVVVANPNTAEAHVTFDAYSDAGVVLGASAQTVPANGKISMLVSQIFDPSVTGKGWILLTSDVPVVAFELYGDGISGGIAALPSSLLGTTLTLGHFVHSARWWTGMALLNPWTGPVLVTVTARDNAGNALAQEYFAIPPRSKLSGMVESLMPEVANKSGWISVESMGGDIAGFLTYGEKQAASNRIAALSAVPASTSLNLSGFYSDSDCWTGIAMVNPDRTASADLTLTAYAPDGTQIDQKIQTLAALNKTVGMVDTIFALDGNTEGWIHVTSTRPIVGLEILNADDAAEQAWGLAAIESQAAGLNVYLPHLVANSRWWTSLSLANPNDSTTSMTLTAWNDDGTELKGVTKEMEPHGRIADYLRELYGL